MTTADEKDTGLSEKDELAKGEPEKAGADKGQPAKDEPQVTKNSSDEGQPAKDGPQANMPPSAQSVPASVTQPVLKGLGYSDFNAGAATVMSNKCLRKAPMPTPCSLCIDGCPTQALFITPDTEILKPNDACIRCGLCVELCPTTAISTTRETTQKIGRRLLDSCLKTQRMIVTCERTMGLARTRAKGDKEVDAGVEDYKGLEAAQKKYLLHVVPCLGMMGAEIWFALLNEMNESILNQLDILLPFGQCDECPVNATGLVEEMFEQAVTTAELWANGQIGLLGEVEDITRKPASLFAPLIEASSSETTLDRREAFSGAFKSLFNVWNTAVETAEAQQMRKLTTVEETVIKRKRRDAYKNTLLGERMASKQAPHSMVKSAQLQPQTIIGTARVTPKRYLLVEALGYNPTNASSVALVVSDTDASACKGCEQCVQVCALKARTMDEDGQKASVDTLVCEGCGVCVTTCPNAANTLTSIGGEAFLL